MIKPIPEAWFIKQKKLNRNHHTLRKIHNYLFSNEEDNSKVVNAFFALKGHCPLDSKTIKEEDIQFYATVSSNI